MPCVTVTYLHGYGKWVKRLRLPAQECHSRPQCYQGRPVAGTLSPKGYPCDPSRRLDVGVACREPMAELDVAPEVVGIDQTARLIN